MGQQEDIQTQDRGILTAHELKEKRSWETSPSPFLEDLQVMVAHRSGMKEASSGYYAEFEQYGSALQCFSREPSPGNDWLRNKRVHHQSVVTFRCRSKGWQLIILACLFIISTVSATNGSIPEQVVGRDLDCDSSSHHAIHNEGLLHQRMSRGHGGQVSLSSFPEVNEVSMLPAAGPETDRLCITHNVGVCTNYRSEDGDSSTERQPFTSTPAPSVLSHPDFKKGPPDFANFTTSAGSALSGHQEQKYFDRYNTATLFPIHRPTLRHAFQVQKTWCMENTCSAGEKLEVMCNSTSTTRSGAGGRKKTSFEQQECDWCWNENSFPQRSPTQQAMIETHCDKASYRAALLLTLACGLLAGSILTFMTILIVRAIRSRIEADLNIRRLESVLEPTSRVKPQRYRWYLPYLMQRQMALSVSQEQEPDRCN